jgi:phage/plasmid-associated DNA primase
MAKLDGITMAWTSELEDGQPLNSAVIKELTGDSQTTYRKCYGRDEITMVITVKPVVLTNTTPLMDGGDSGLETRLRKIPFRHTQLVKGKPTIENQEMLARLKTQDGINATFAWFVEGAIQVYEDCDNGQSRLDPPESVVEEGKEFMEDSDSVKAFLDECCQVWTPQSNEDIRAFAYRRRPFQKDYNDFCRRQNFSKTQTLSSSLVVEKIKKLFPQNKTKDRGDWVGIRPKPAENYGL